MAKKKIRSLSVGDRIWNQLRALAKKEESSMSELAREAFTDLFKKRNAGMGVGKYNPATDTYD